MLPASYYHRLKKGLRSNNLEVHLKEEMHELIPQNFTKEFQNLIRS